jgi:hypothetical protein
VTDLDEDPEQATEGELVARARVARAEHPEHLVEVRLDDEAHRVEGAEAGLLADVVDRDDAGVLEVAGELRLALQASGGGLLVLDLRLDALQGDAALERAVEALDDLAHPALAQEASCR